MVGQTVRSGQRSAFSPEHISLYKVTQASHGQARISGTNVFEAFSEWSYQCPGQCLLLGRLFPLLNSVRSRSLLWAVVC